MKAKLFKFQLTDFEEVYAIIDEENQRLHISPVYYRYSLTLDLTKDLNEEILLNTKWGEMSFNMKVRQVAEKIIDELGLRKGVKENGNA